MSGGKLPPWVWPIPTCGCGAEWNPETQLLLHLKGCKCNCGARWTGTKVEHCASCHQSFSGNRIGDRHRVTEGPGRRRCLTSEEMTAKGWVPARNTFGHLVWRLPGPAQPIAFAHHQKSEDLTDDPRGQGTPEVDR